MLDSCHGAAAVEFALIAPVLVAMWVGIIELSEAYIVGRKISVAAQAVSDLVAQAEAVSQGDIDDINSAVFAIIDPYPLNNVGIDISSVEADNNGRVRVGWRVRQGNVGRGGGATAEARQLVTVDDSVIVASLNYVHQPALALLFGNINMSEVGYARPRRVRQIPFQ